MRLISVADKSANCQRIASQHRRGLGLAAAELLKPPEMQSSSQHQSQTEMGGDNFSWHNEVGLRIIRVNFAVFTRQSSEPRRPRCRLSAWTCIRDNRRLRR